MIGGYDKLIYNKHFWFLETNSTMLVEIVDRCLLMAGFNVLKFNDHEFKPVGYTSFWLLAESHIALHTFPEHDVSYMEITCCNELKFETLSKLLLEELHEVINK